MSSDLGAQQGFTLVELLVGMVVVMVVMLATFSVLDDSTRMAGHDNERALAIREGQVGIDRLVRELRHARAVHAATAQVLDVTVQRRGAVTRVVFRCDAAVSAGVRACTRTPSGGAAEVLVKRVRDVGTDPSAFSYTPQSPPAPLAGIRHVTVRLGLAVDGGASAGHRRDVVLSDGTAMRNVP